MSADEIAEALEAERDEAQSAAMRYHAALTYIAESFIQQADGSYKTYTGPEATLASIHMTALQVLALPPS